MQQAKKKVVILGCGFGGMYAAKELLGAVKRGEIELAIINKTNYFLFTPLLHEVATGGLTAGSVSESIRNIFAGYDVQIYEGDAEVIDPTTKSVSIAGRTIPYDYLVVTTGAKTNYYNTPGAAEHALELKDLDDALRIKSRIIERFEQAALATDSDEKRALLSFIIVGGGATGVELAGELIQFCSLLAKRFFNHSQISKKDITIALLTAGTEILTQFEPKLRSVAAAQLEQSGIAIRYNMQVTEVTPEGIRTKDGTAFTARTVFWVAGVKPNLPVFASGDVVPISPTGRIQTDEYMRVAGHAGVFAFGDAASKKDSNGKELPMLAQVASRQAPIVARNILALIHGKELTSYEWKSKGSLISLGQWFAVGEIYSMGIAGTFAWWMWRTVYLFKFPTWRKRLSIATEWTANIFFARDITKPE